MAKPLTIPMIGGIPKINAAFYGPGGVGKTTLAAGFATHPLTSPALWIDCYGNPHLLVLNESIQYGFTLEDWRDMEKPIDFFMSKQPANHPMRKDWGIPEDVVFRSVIIDTLSDEQRLLIDYIIEKRPGRDTDLVKIEAKVHGAEIGGTTLHLVRQLLSCPVHTIVTYQLYEKLNFVGDDKGSIVSVGSKNEISLWGSSRQIIPPWHNLMAELVFEEQLIRQGNRMVRKPVLVAYFRDTRSIGKNQLSPSMGEKMEDPTAEKILAYIEKDWSEA